MPNTNFNQYKANNFEKSFQALMQLNVNTIQRWFFSSHEEFFKGRHPDNVLENTVDILVENSKKNLDYMHEVLNIFESNILQPTENAVKKTSHEIKKYRASELSTIKKAATTAKRVINANTTQKNTPKKRVASTPITHKKEAEKHVLIAKNGKKTANLPQKELTKSLSKTDKKINK